MSTQPETDSFPIRSQETNPILQRGGQPGNTNALRHGFYSERFNSRQLHSLLSRTVSEEEEAASGSDQGHTRQVNLNTSLAQHLNILQSLIQDLAQTAADGEGAAVPLLLQGIRVHASLVTLAHTLQNTPTPTHYRPNNPEGHSRCRNCGNWWKNYLLTPEGICSRCSVEEED